nr:MAG TPA: hypothetical protein [Caudoviricetes sp.]
MRIIDEFGFDITKIVNVEVIDGKVEVVDEFGFNITKIVKIVK